MQSCTIAVRSARNESTGQYRHIGFTSRWDSIDRLGAFASRHTVELRVAVKRDCDILIIGSGPAGVSAALPLVKAGLNVLMVDGGRRVVDPPPPRISWSGVERNGLSLAGWLVRNSRR